MQVFGAPRRQKPAFPKFRSQNQDSQNLPNPSQTLPRPFSTIAASFSAIFGSASAQIFIYKHIQKNSQNIGPAVRPAVIKSAASAASPEGFQAVIKSAASAASLAAEKIVKNEGKIAFWGPLYRKSGFDPKVKSSKMGLSITPRGWGSEPTRFAAAQPHFRNI